MVTFGKDFDGLCAKRARAEKYVFGSEPFGRHLGAFGAIWGSFGSHLGPFGCLLGPPWCLFGTMGVLLNPMLVAVGLAPAIAAAPQPEPGGGNSGEANTELGPPVRLDAYPVDLFMSDSNSDGSD